MNNDPHAHSPVLTRGPAPEAAALTLVMIHGRGASAESILSLFDAMQLPTIAAVAPQAAGGTWYPHSFLAPLAGNQPWLDSALGRVAATVDELIARGVPSARIALLGFSQGACLTSEFLVRHPRRYAAAMILTGGVIGPLDAPRAAPTGSLDGTPILLSAGEPDAHVPIARAIETDALLQSIGARVDFRRYPGRPHTVGKDEFDACRELLVEIAHSS